jgi:hypothetical protein
MVGEAQTQGGAIEQVWQRVGKFTNITTATTTTAFSGKCILERVVVNTTAAGTVVIYDNTAASGTKIASLPASPAVGGYEYGCLCANGVTIVTGAATDLTVVVTPFN